MAFNNQKPIFNPIIPFTGSIQGELQEGKQITVAGRVLPGTPRFHVNLQCGSMTGSDVAFHFNPRFDGNSGYVVANTFQNSKWGQEERKYEKPFPQGSNFTLTFIVGRDSFEVITNGRHFMEYKHRISLSRVENIKVGGGVEVAFIAIQNPENQRVSPGELPPPYESKQGSLLDEAMTGYPPLSFGLSYKAHLSGGTYPGRSITVQGVVTPSATSFHIRLCYGSDIALNFNPRFDENKVVLNSKVMEKWGIEERSGKMPFQRGQPFVVTIGCEYNLFRIMIDGHQAFTFSHRYHILQEINSLEMDGDFNLISVIV